MIYLASPYSNPNPRVRDQRFRAVCAKAAGMTRNGLLVYSPIAHSHPLAALGLPGDWAYWERHNAAMLERCSALVVLALPGWAESRGVAAEMEIACRLGLPVRFEDATEAVLHG